MGPLRALFYFPKLKTKKRQKPDPEQAMSEKSHDPNQMTGAAMIVRALADHGVKHLFGYPGGAVLPIYDEIFQQSEVRHILVRHEQGAGHAAEGYARSTGKPGVVLVTSGPGATNMVTPLTDALMDSIPLVCITGQVPTHLIGNDAFQECDTVGITRPCTKHNWLVRDVNDLAKVLHEAFYVASTGRPGPVVVDVPKDVQFAVGTYHPPRKSDVHLSYTPRVKGDAAQIRKAVALLASAKRPMIYTGGGVINSGLEASKLLRELVEAKLANKPLPKEPAKARGKVVDLMSALRQSLAAKEVPKGGKAPVKSSPAKRKLKVVGKSRKTA